MEENNVNSNETTVNTVNIGTTETPAAVNYDAKIEELQKTINTLKGKLTTLEEQRASLYKKADDLVAKTIYEKKQEIEKTYSEVLTEAEKRLKAAEKEKADERKKNIDVLVEKNTRSIRENNVYLNNEIKRVLKDNKMPGFVNSTLYLSLWSPSSIGQFFLGLLIVLILIAIPTACCFLIFKKEINDFCGNNQVLYVIFVSCVYLVFIFVFGGIWLLIDKTSKKSPEALKQVKELRKNIDDNKKEIDKIAKKTSKETTDDQFDYTKLDREIEAGKIEVESYKTKREEAITNFSNITQDEITNKIKAEAKTEIDVIDTEIAKVKEELVNVQKEHDDIKLKACDEKTKS